MKDKIYEFVMLIVWCVLYGIAIGALILNGIKNIEDVIVFICISVIVVYRTFKACRILLNRGN